MKSTTWIKDGCDFRASDEQQAQMNFKKKTKGLFSCKCSIIRAVKRKLQENKTYAGHLPGGVSRFYQVNKL